ncbi:MAG: hypothetical protein AYK18_04260 [Theionarchaea archaeon DG-70]|nr:MAG: hypothetical protein AYK18_04260 [Theionarchaea archaeon DG-70]
MNYSLDKYTTHVKGENRGNIVMFTLNSCPWCRKTKQLLNTIGVEYSYVDIDCAAREDRQRLMETLEKWNPACIFPTVVINKDQCISGHNQFRIREALEKHQSTVDKEN